MKYPTFEEDLSKLQTPLTTTDLTMGHQLSTVTVLSSRRQRRRKAAVATEMAGNRNINSGDTTTMGGGD